MHDRLGEETSAGDGDAPARFRWLPRPLRPPPGMTVRQERALLVVGTTILYAGYDMSIYGFAMPQIQEGLHIPEAQAAVTIAYFRMAAIAAMFICAAADIVGRRRLLLITIVGQTLATVATAFATDYTQFVWLQVIGRVFGYCEEMLCAVVVAEEANANARGWAIGMLTTLYFAGSAAAALVFAAINVLPFGWRAIYFIGAVPLLLLAYTRRSLPETQRFAMGADELQRIGSNVTVALSLAKRLVTEYPVRVIVILASSSLFSFAITPAFSLGFKHMQQSLGFSPFETTQLYLTGGLLAVCLNVLASRWSDSAGRKSVLTAMSLLSAVCFAVFFSGLQGWIIPPVWILAYFGYFAADALYTGYALEIVPTAYRATMSGISFTVRNLTGAASLALEGHLYGIFESHGLGVMLPLLAMPIALVMLVLLPDPAGRTLEEISDRSPERRSTGRQS